MSNIVWQPDESEIKNTQMFRFIQYINQHYNHNINDYHALYQWSIEQRELFWQAIWHFFAIKHSQAYTHVMKHGSHMLKTQWFTGAKLNFAENLLSRQDSKTALIFRNEKGERRTLSYHQLYLEVAATAKALKAAGIEKNDRVAGYMANTPETIIAMLATASIGAIWSSCSPDFGAQGIVDRFSQIEPKLLFASDGQFYNGKTHDSLVKLPDILKQLPSIETVVIVPYINNSAPNSSLADLTSTKHIVNYQQFKQPAEVIEFEPLAFDHPVYIMFSSGTTGVPKCIVHGAGGTLIQHLKELSLHCNITEKDTFFYFTSCGWMMWNWLVSGLALGATLVLYDGAPQQPKADYLFDLIDEENITQFGVSAKYISACEKAHIKPFETHQLTSLKQIFSTGSPLMPNHYDYVYQQIKSKVALCSISGGTDIISCFGISCPILPIYRGELQCRGLGMDVAIYNDLGEAVIEQKGELICQQSFPSMPVYFWNDANGTKYLNAYFQQFKNIWTHGDYAQLTQHQGLIIYGRSDTALNPGGVRIGTAEIYRQVETLDEIIDSIVIGQEWQDDTRVILFVKLREQLQLNETLIQKIKHRIRQHASPRHVPSKIIQVPDIPKTVSGKIVELAVRDVVHGRQVKNKEALANPEALAYFSHCESLQY